MHTACLAYLHTEHGRDKMTDVFIKKKYQVNVPSAMSSAAEAVKSSTLMSNAGEM